MRFTGRKLAAAAIVPAALLGIGLNASQAASAAPAHVTTTAAYQRLQPWRGQAFSTMRTYYRYINEHDYAGAWLLWNRTGSTNTAGQSFREFVAGYRTTAYVSISPLGEHRTGGTDTTFLNIAAYQTNGSVVTYRGWYTVNGNGYIVMAHVAKTGFTPVSGRFHGRLPIRGRRGIPGGVTFYQGGWYKITGPCDFSAAAGGCTGHYIGTIRPPGYSGGEPKAPMSYRAPPPPGSPTTRPTTPPTTTPPGSPPPSTPPPPTTPPPSTPAPPTTPPPTTSGPPPAALAAWQATANDPSASVSTALMQVAGDLPSSDATQIAQLDQLASLPPTGDTPAQQAQGQADVTALDAFFNTPGFQPNL